MRNIFVVHSAGAQGDRQGSAGLVAGLKAGLGADYNVLYPLMPEPEAPSYEPWRAKVKEELDNLQGEVLLIGHSLGGSVLLKYLSEEDFSIDAAGLFLIAAPFWGSDGDWQAEEYLLRKEFSSTINDSTKVFLYHSADDDIVPFEHFLLYKKEFPSAVVRSLDGYGHRFENGLPELVEDIKHLYSK